MTLEKITKYCKVISIFLLFGGCASMVDENIIRTKIVMSSMFRNHVVLQREKPVPVWGKAQAGKTIQVTFADQKKTTVVDKNGFWMVTLDPLQASSSPRDMKIDYLLSGKETIEEGMYFAVKISDVVVGEVWLCSGQSNMELGMAGIENGIEELDDTNYPNIRIYFIGKNASAFPLDRISSVWIPSERSYVAQMGWKGFSAVGYLFGRQLHHELDMPIGIIQAAYGGSAIVPWIPPEELEATPGLERYFLEWDNANKKYGEALKTDPEATHPFKEVPADTNKIKPVTLYNAMIYPVVPFAIRGALWYQGESDVGTGMVYAEKMKALIGGWRRVFNDAAMPFYYVQLPPWDYGNDSSLPAMWEAQESCLAIENTGMAVTVDVGDPKDIHPTKKKEVAQRLALIALTKTYGRDIEYSGPVFRDMKIDNDRIVIGFDHATKGLVAKDGKPLSWFEVAGADGSFVPADAKIDGNKVIVSSAKVKSPVAVRYAWHALANPNLFNTEGLPARPFKTDK